MDGNRLGLLPVFCDSFELGTPWTVGLAEMTVVPLQLGGMFGSGLPLEKLPFIGRKPKAKSARTIPQAAAGTKRIARAAAAREERAVLHVDRQTDEGLLVAYLDGDRSAFTKLINRYKDELLHFLIRFLGSRAAAEDVFQETFLQVHLSAQTFDATRRFKPWLFTIAANKARDYHRKHSRNAPMSLSASIDSNGEGESFVDLVQANVDDPNVPLLDAERSQLVKQVVDSMPAHLREILLLSYFQRLSYNQIADSLEIPLGTVKSRLHAAVASFAKAWMQARGHDEDVEQSRSPLTDEPRP
jgi:RNA polymerase sigma-70 factor (ECF subfamily)